MKKIGIYLICLFIFVNICACNNSSNNVETNVKYSDDKFAYSLTEVCSFLAYESNVYAAFRYSPEVKILDNDANIIGTLYFGAGYHTNLCEYDNSIYALTYGESFVGITEYNLITENYEFHPIDTQITSVISMSVINDNIYLIYWSDTHDEIQESIKYNENDDYSYMGEKAICISLDDFSCSDMEISNVIGLKKYNDTEILYYAYDNIGGYYFTVYNTENKTFSEKIYNNNIGYTFSFAYNESNDNIVYSDFSNKKLTTLSIQPTDTRIDFMANVVAASGNDVQISGDNCYVLDNMTGDIYRIEYNEAVHDNEEITFYSSQIYSEVPFGCGYKINTYMLSNEEFALNVLAGNNDYDICMMSSEQTFSKNIRDKSAFYPLNDLPMIKEYLDACFPYIKESAIDKNGQIWMIPIAVDVPCIVFNPENCAEQEINFSNETTWQYLFNVADELYKKEEFRDKYQLNGYQAQANILRQYNAYYAFKDNTSNYSTSLFRKLCEMLNKYDMNSESLHTWIMPISAYINLDDYYNDYIFELIPYKFNLFDRQAFETLRAVKLPDICDTMPSCANCIYFCVNSNSKNLNNTLSYINSYCSYMLGRTDTYMFKDMTTYEYCETPLVSDLYSIYSNAQVNFELSSEMFWDDYGDYTNGNLSFEELVAEIERKTKMFIYE